MSEPHLADVAEPPSITCPACLMTSYNVMDFNSGWCGNCRRYTTPRPGWCSQDEIDAFAAVLAEQAAIREDGDRPSQG